MDFFEYEHLLLEAVLSGSLHDIVHAAFKYFKKPIYLVDGSTKLVEHFPKDETTEDMVFNKIVVNRSMPKDLIDLIFDANIYSLTINETNACYLDAPELGVPRISGAVIYDKQRIGAYGIACEKEPTEQMMHAADLFSAALAVVMDKNAFYTTSRELLENIFFHDLIDGKLKEETDIIPWSKYCEQILYGNYCMLIGENIQEKHDFEMEYLCRRLSTKFHKTLSCVKNNKIYVLICDVKENSGKAHRIADFLHTQNVVCGISRRYKHLQDTQESCFMAEEALAQGRRQFPAQHYYEFDSFLAESALEKVISCPYRGVYFHPVFEMLRAYDTQNGSELYASLCEYMLCFKDLNAAAKRMNIHRNTLKYRIDRICEIGNIDMDDESTAKQLYLGSCFAKYELLQ